MLSFILDSKTYQNLEHKLYQHRLYQLLQTPDDLKLFMSHHIYAVWDFMSLAKSLQRKLTCMDPVWNPTGHPEITRFINEVIVAEESDLLPDGQIMSHFELYLKAMKEMGIKTDLVLEVTSTRSLEKLPPACKKFVTHNIDVATGGSLLQVLCYFLFGREKIIPDMFSAMIDQLPEQQTRTLKLYLQRHVDLDGEEHGPMIEKCLSHFIKTVDDENLAREFAFEAMFSRIELWDNVASLIEDSKADTLPRPQHSLH